MDLYLTSTCSENLHLVSTNGISHYRITTFNPYFGDGPKVTLIQRPIAASEDTAESLVAEIDWTYGDYPTIIRGASVCEQSEGGCIGSMGVGVKASKFLKKGNLIGSFIQFNSNTRHFQGDDGLEYRWKTMKGEGCNLTRTDTKEEIAISSKIVSLEGAFAGERTEVLRIQPGCAIEIDLIVLTYVLKEMKRWERERGDIALNGDDEPAGDGADAEGDTAEAGDDTGANVMMGEM